MKLKREHLPINDKSVVSGRLTEHEKMARLIGPRHYDDFGLSVDLNKLAEETETMKNNPPICCA